MLSGSIHSFFSENDGKLALKACIKGSECENDGFVTPLKINMERNHGFLGDHFPF